MGKRQSSEHELTSAYQPTFVEKISTKKTSNNTLFIHV